MDIKQVYVDEVFEIFQKNDDSYDFVDVREPDEWEAGTIPGSKRIPLGELPEHLDELDKSKKIIMVCRSGARSNRASQFLMEKGFADVSNFQGGMLSWYDEDHPVE